MSSRLNFFHKQAVTEAELDLAFELLEKADRDLASDIGIYGIVSGADPVPHSPVPDLTIDLTAPGRSYDHLGQRIFFGTDQRVDCSIDYTGIPTQVSSSGNERWLGIFLRFDRLLSDPRTDGNSQQVYFRQDESFQIRVRQSPEGPIGSAPKVPLVENELLVCDIRRTAGQTQLFEVDIDQSRRQAFIFAKGDAVEIASALWTAIQPAVATVQAAFDSVDDILASHLNGSNHRHSAGQVDYTPHGFVDANTVQGAVDELVDDLASTDPGSSGASLVGSDAVADAPNALPPGSIHSQLIQVLNWLNTHISASSGAHNASAIAAVAHNYISGASVQAQLQEIVNDLQSQDSSLGAAQVGDAAISGSPDSLSAGTVRDQLSDLLAAINTHQNASTDAHPASAVSVADTAEDLDAADAEGALAEILGALKMGHYLGNETNAGNHRAIEQPIFGGFRSLLWDSRGVGNSRARFRVHADSQSIWFTVNAFWNGGAWEKDNPTTYAGGFHFSRSAFEFVHHHGTSDSTFAAWDRFWRLRMGATTNSGFEAYGTIQEIGRLGMAASNPYTESRWIIAGGAVTFRSRLPSTPSSITFSEDMVSFNFSGTPEVRVADRDGFAFHTLQWVSPNLSFYWYGRYTAIA
ncbi:MAG: hypothetical protein QNJ97_29305 [Myxococcota bacterium]|nr:hypothetical protein [Myxococcota bacterium]